MLQTANTHTSPHRISHTWHTHTTLKKGLHSSTKLFCIFGHSFCFRFVFTNGEIERDIASKRVGGQHKVSSLLPTARARCPASRTLIHIHITYVCGGWDWGLGASRVNWYWANVCLGLRWPQLNTVTKRRTHRHTERKRRGAPQKLQLIRGGGVVGEGREWINWACYSHFSLARHFKDTINLWLVPTRDWLGT